MFLKPFAIVFAGFVVFVIVQADRGQLPDAFSLYREAPFGDTIGHFILIGGTAFFANLALELKTVRLGGRSILKGSVLVGVLAFLEELSQIAIPTRTFSLSDLLADGAGIFVAEILARRVGRLFDKASGE